MSSVWAFAAEASKPNIILIMADDLGYADLSCYGSRSIQTPALDKLAKEGVKCTDFHSNGAVCSPTRAALMTGRYQQRSGVSGVITAKSHRDKGLAIEEWTMAEAMKEQGYQTAMFGKWHLGYEVKFNPIHQGFDEFKGFVSGNIDYHRHIDQEGHFDWWIQDDKRDEPGYLTDLITRHSLDFVRRNAKKPFFMLLNHGAPHYPIQGRKDPGFRVLDKTHGKQPRLRLADPKATYKEMIEVMDEGIGKLVNELDRLGIRENTFMVFCSDNGPAAAGSPGPFKGKKGSVWEGGHRVCGIFNWPGRIPAQQVCADTLMTMDLLPTFVSLTGATVPTKRKLDGIDIFGSLTGTKQDRGPVFWQHNRGSAVRDGQLKLVIHGKKAQLYDLAKDPSETTDLAQDQPEQAERLKKLLNDWKDDVQPTTKTQN